MTNPALKLLEELFNDQLADTSGEVATYIPELAKADANGFCAVLTTIDGNSYRVGDQHTTFTIQSVSKPFAYAHALEHLGREAVLKRVGVEPTGDAFNSIELDQHFNRPYNPMVNAGAIAVSAMFAGASVEAASRAMLGSLSDFAGRPLNIDDAVFRSEDRTGHRNRAIAWLMYNSGMLERPPDEALGIYFRQCAVTVSAIDLSVMAATFANGGINPITKAIVASPQTVQDTLSVMLTCGMYNYAGQWAHEVGVPAKSGVSGAVVAVVPGQFGLAVWSPRLDAVGNSVRGVNLCKALSQKLGLHMLRPASASPELIRRKTSLASLRSKWLRQSDHSRLLDQHGRLAHVIELQGVLRFAEAERMIREVNKSMHGGALCLVLNLKRIRHVEPDGLRLLSDFLLGAHGGISVRCIMPDVTVLKLSPQLIDSQVLVADLDEALEWAEQFLLERPNIAPDVATLPADTLLRGLDAVAVARFRDLCEPVILKFADGDVIIREGEIADLLYFIRSGTVRVQLGAGPAALRIETLGPGVMFGEMAILQSGKRTADVIALGDVICEAISLAALQQLKFLEPGLYSSLLGNFAIELAEKLKRSNTALRQLRDS